MHPDPFNWSVSNVRSWLLWQIEQYNLSSVRLDFFNVSGIELCSLTEEDFKERAPVSGETLFAQLDIWKTGRLLNNKYVYLNLHH